MIRNGPTFSFVLNNKWKWITTFCGSNFLIRWKIFLNFTSVTFELDNPRHSKSLKILPV